MGEIGVPVEHEEKREPWQIVIFSNYAGLVSRFCKCGVEGKGGGEGVREREGGYKASILETEQ